MNLLRRLPLSRLLIVCGLVAVLGVSLTALAFALGSGPVPPAKSLPQAVHDALPGPAIAGVSAEVKLTDHLLEGAELASAGGGGGSLASDPLLTGASGRMWISDDGRVRLELQSEKGDTQVIYDGHTLSMYDAATNTLYRYTPPADSGKDQQHGSDAKHEAPSVAQVEEAISHLDEHADVSGAAPTDVGGQPAYTVRVSPKESGSLIGGAELSFDANHGIPLRAAVYSSTSAAPVVELAASNVSYEAVPDSVFAFTPPADAKVEEVKLEPPEGHAQADTGERPKVTTHGSGVTAIAVVQAAAKAGETGDSALQGLPQVDINGAKASELGTALGTVLSFERSGVRYLVGGFLPRSTVEAYARGL